MALGLLTFSDSSLIQMGWPAQRSAPRIRLYGLGLLLIILFSTAGCDGSFLGSKSIPAPIAQEFPYEIQTGSIVTIWGGDNFEVMHDGLLHYLVLQGIDSPKPGQEYFRESQKQLDDLITRHYFRVIIYGLDEEKREIARVFVDDLDVNFEMVRTGAAWFDGKELGDSESFKSAEKEARAKKIGLWKNPDPIHPSEF